jgi:P pilus assembly chaperone PapD
MALAAAWLALASVPADRALAQAAPPAPAPAPAASPAAPGSTNSVGANLNISPKRVTFDRADRTATIYVFNQGTAAATFDITLVDRIMQPDGQIMAVTEAQTHPEDKDILDKLKSAQGMLVVSPRRATLEPGKGQTIRIRAAAPVTGDAGNPPPAGEYRTHLTVTTIPPRDIGLTAEQAASLTPQELRFQINSVFGLSIPVIVRVGNPDVRGAIENVKLSTQNLSPDGAAPPRPTPVLSFQLVRLGPNSLFGNIDVRGSKDKASANPLAAARGIGVYPEIDRRQVQMPLTRAPQPGEQLEISFKDDDTAPGRLVAKATFTTP